MTAARLCYDGTGAGPSPRRLLRAGPLTLSYGDGELRYVRLGDREVVRRWHTTVRDHNWGTIPPRVLSERWDVRDDAFSVELEAENRRGAIDFRWTGVVTGDAEVGKAFTHLPFDHLFFTGSTPVGRLVAQAAAQRLTPVTLELGGKSPAIVDRSADLALAAERIAFGKLLNAGQTCVAPDYVLAPKELVQPLADAIVAAVRRLYPRIDGNPDYTAIVSPRQRRTRTGCTNTTGRNISTVAIRMIASASQEGGAKATT